MCQGMNLSVAIKRQNHTCKIYTQKNKAVATKVSIDYF